MPKSVLLLVSNYDTKIEKNLDADSQNEGPTGLLSATDSDSDVGENDDQEDGPETPYVPVPEEEFHTQTGEQVEELTEGNKSLIWILLKQVRPGMDLSKVVLPTFILEPRSFLDKLSDSYYHADILSRAVMEDDPFTRMKYVVQWYLSGFYKKPKGLKKPYNPILGECYRCYWEHPNGSRTFYIAEQVSHHPPISAFYVTNRQDGFCISCSILAKSKFYGNSTSAMLEGVATLTLLPRGESYTLTTPYAHCKGILVGTLSMELGGKINIECENTGYKTDLEFKLKSFLGGSENTNLVVGKIKLGKETLATLHGHWDSEIQIKDSKSHEETTLFIANKEMTQQRLTRYVVPIESQLPNESERLWQKVSDAIINDDQVGATEEKTVLEVRQREKAKELKETGMDWIPMHFQQDLITGQWIYKYADLRPWDPRNDVKQYESNYRVLTKTQHQAPLVRTASTIDGDPMHVLSTDGRQNAAVLKAKRRSKSFVQIAHDTNLSDTSRSQSQDLNIKKRTTVSDRQLKRLQTAIDQVNKSLDEHTRQLLAIQARLERIQYAPSGFSFRSASSNQSLSLFDRLPSGVSETTVLKTVVYAFVGMFLLAIYKWLTK